MQVWNPNETINCEECHYHDFVLAIQLAGKTVKLCKDCLLRLKNEIDEFV